MSEKVELTILLLGSSCCILAWFFREKQIKESRQTRKSFLYVEIYGYMSLLFSALAIAMGVILLIELGHLIPDIFVMPLL